MNKNIALRCADLIALAHANPGLSRADAIAAACAKVLAKDVLSIHISHHGGGRPRGIASWRRGKGRRILENSWVQVKLPPEVWQPLERIARALARRYGLTPRLERVSYAIAAAWLARDSFLPGCK